VFIQSVQHAVVTKGVKTAYIRQ